MFSNEDLIIKLLLVLAVGGVIGAEREYSSKSAGFRTMILICLGSFLFTTFSLLITDGTNDRIASNIVTGIGFLGAGVIFQSENRINGITTAATIWAVAALGMGIASGYYFLVIIATILVLICLFILTGLDASLDKINLVRNYKIVSPYKQDLITEYETMFHQHQLRFKRIKQAKAGKYITGSWVVRGKQKNHAKFIDKILHDDTVIEFEF
jgi:putative Mg2+ transporter-C (MgtC) family protein